MSIFNENNARICSEDKEKTQLKANNVLFTDKEDATKIFRQFHKIARGRLAKVDIICL